MPDHGFVNFKDPIPMYVSGFGPKSLALAGQHGDGAVLSIPPNGKMMERMWEMIERGAVANNQPINRDNYLTCSLTPIVVLDEDETLSSPRVKA